jgi:BCD family chlorophyll transporter-like MFS transporter
LNLIALWKQETRDPKLLERSIKVPTFKESWSSFTRGDRAVRRLVAVGLGTMGFSMGDVLLEPYGGEILHLTVSQTTVLTATLAVGGLSGFALASKVLARGYDPFRMACYGAAVGAPAFLAIILAAFFQSQELFALGTACIGFGAGLFGHGTLTATMNLAPEGQKGLALGSWGAAQASAAGAAIALGGVIRDASAEFMAREGFGAAGGYIAVYGLEAALLVITLGAMLPLLRRASPQPSPASA